MIIWGIFIPCMTLCFILYFQYIDKLFQGKKEIYKIDRSHDINSLDFELRYTGMSLILFSLVGLFTGFCIDRGWTQVYTAVDLSSSGIIYLIASFFIAVGMHDIYFYLTHRLLHLKFIFKNVHSWHHKSHRTNSWAAFSFHPIEGIFQIGIVPLVAFVLPIHETVLFLFTGFLLFMSVYGHSGYELRANKLGALNVFNTSLHHSQHHRYINYNFGIYFNLWDRMFSTNHPEYQESFKNLSKRILKDGLKAKDSNRAG